MLFSVENDDGKAVKRKRNAIYGMQQCCFILGGFYVLIWLATWLAESHYKQTINQFALRDAFRVFTKAPSFRLRYSSFPGLSTDPLKVTD